MAPSVMFTTLIPIKLQASFQTSRLDVTVFQPHMQLHNVNTVLSFLAKSKHHVNDQHCLQRNVRLIRIHYKFTLILLVLCDLVIPWSLKQASVQHCCIVATMLGYIKKIQLDIKLIHNYTCSLVEKKQCG